MVVDPVPQTENMLFSCWKSLFDLISYSAACHDTACFNLWHFPTFSICHGCASCWPFSPYYPYTWLQKHYFNQNYYHWFFTCWIEYLAPGTMKTTTIIMKHIYSFSVECVFSSPSGCGDDLPQYDSPANFIQH